MKRLFVIMLFLLFTAALQAQFFSVGTGRVFGKFLYKNSEGTEMKNLSLSDEPIYGFDLSFPLSKPVPKLQLALGANLLDYHIQGCDTLLGNSFQWRAKFLQSYLMLKYEIGASYIFFNDKNGFSLLLMAGGGADFLIYGIQNIDGNLHNLVGAPEFKYPFPMVLGGIGTKYYFSKTAQVYFQYIGGLSFLFGDNTGKEQLRLVEHSFTVGIAINLSLSKYLK